MHTEELDWADYCAGMLVWVLEDPFRSNMLEALDMQGYELGAPDTLDRERQIN